MYVADVILTKHNRIKNKIELEEDTASGSGDFIRHTRWRILCVVFSVIKYSFPTKEWDPVGFMAIGAHRASGGDAQLSE